MATMFASTRARERILILISIVVLLLGAGLIVAQRSEAIDGAISGAIEIDTNANHYPGGSSADCTPLEAGTDWVKDCLANTDTPSLVDSIATGIDPGVTGRVGGTGHWNGVRIVDGFAGNDDDIFLTGGKENDESSWNVGPGSVGSSKYDATQAYLANNQTTLFFGMERRGNNGTTAFDFEFNQVAPANATTYIPTRTEDDVLLTFEMQGSGGSGSATPHYYTWDGDEYVEGSLPAGTLSTINTDTSTAAPPWGHVSGNSGWVGGNLQRFEFAEAKVPLSILPGVNACGGTAYTQIRTRSSSTENSDLKDTTKIFEFQFGSPSASASKTSANGTNSSVLLGSSSTGITTPTYQWQVKQGANWTNIASATNSTLTYSAFETDATPTATSFTLASGAAAGSYEAKLYTVELRVLITDSGTNCTGTSPAVTVKKLIAVDP